MGHTPATIEFKDGGEIIVPDGTGTPGGFTDLNDALKPLQDARLHDPGIANLIDTPEHPAPAAQTTDPHRITFMLPNSEHTVFSLGEAGAHDANHIADTGITGRTDKHIHFRTTEGEFNTMLVLGEHASVNEAFQSYKGDVLTAGAGFLAVTDANAWIDAKEFLYAVAREKDVIVRAAGEEGAPKVLVQSDEGPVFVRGEGIVLSGKNEVAISANTASHKLDPGYAQRVAPTLVEEAKQTWEQHAAQCLELVQIALSVLDTVRAVAHERHEALHEQAGWKVKSLAEFAEIAVEAAKALKTASTALKAHETPGSVSVQAQHEVGIVAGGDLELFGTTGVGVASTLSVDIIGATTGMKALTFGSVWAGVNASMAAGKEVLISSGMETKVVSKKEVAVTAHHVKIGATGAGVVVVQAPDADGTAAIFGKKSVYLASDGYGLKATKESLVLGSMTSPSHFTSAAIAGDKKIEIDDKKIHLKHGTTEVLIEPSKFTLIGESGGSVKIENSGQLVLGGNKVLIG